MARQLKDMEEDEYTGPDEHGLAACRQQKRVRFFAAASLAIQLEEAQKKYQLERALAKLDKVDGALRPVISSATTMASTAMAFGHSSIDAASSKFAPPVEVPGIIHILSDSSTRCAASC